MYRIRFHGRGGQGMKTASRILGSAFFHEGFEVQDAPRYGAERRGAPIFAYVRAARETINERGIIKKPDLVIVADDSLVAIPAAGIVQGISEDTTILINSTEEPDTWKERLNFKGTVLSLPKEEEVVDPLQLRFAGAACAGAATQLIGIISRDSLEKAIRDEIGDMGEEVVKRNLGEALEAYDRMAGHAGSVKEGLHISAKDYDKPQWLDLPFEDARVSAPVIHAAATSEAMKTGLWRTMRPEIDHELCNKCWWLCSTFCPDSAININNQGYPEIDYEHCKGCMICVAQCPPHAISAHPEHESEGGNR